MPPISTRIYEDSNSSGRIKGLRDKGIMKLKLEEPFKSKWKKAYLRESKEDGRKRVDLVNSNTDRTTISYARYLVCVNLGYELGEGYEVDHIDADCTNDSLDNLQVLTCEEHREKCRLERTTGRTFSTLTCDFCGTEFERERGKCSDSKQYKSSFCSRSCMGKVAVKHLHKNKFSRELDETTRQPRKHVKISVNGTNFKITLNGVCYTFPEDEYVDLEFKRLFQSLGFKVQINEYLW